MNKPLTFDKDAPLKWMKRGERKDSQIASTRRLRSRCRRYVVLEIKSKLDGRRRYLAARVLDNGNEVSIPTAARSLEGAKDECEVARQRDRAAETKKGKSKR